MDERADGGWAGHCVRQPHKERNLRTLSSNAQQHEHSNECDHRCQRQGIRADSDCAVAILEPLVGEDEYAVSANSTILCKTDVLNIGGQFGMVGHFAWLVIVQ